MGTAYYECEACKQIVNAFSFRNDCCPACNVVISDNTWGKLVGFEDDDWNQYSVPIKDYKGRTVHLVSEDDMLPADEVAGRTLQCVVAWLRTQPEVPPSVVDILEKMSVEDLENGTGGST